MFSFGRSRRSPRVRSRPLQVETLENRAVLSTLYVTSTIELYASNRFKTLADAVKFAALGDIIQIEPASAPDNGQTVLIDKQVTIQGDPLRGRANIPDLPHGLTVYGGVQGVLPGVNGVVLDSLNVSGPITLEGGSSHTTIKNCLLLSGVVETAGTNNSGNVIEDCTFANSARVNLTGYDFFFATADQVLRNHFTGALDSAVVSLSDDNGAVIQGNTFSLDEDVVHPGAFGTFIDVSNSGAFGTVLIADNTLKFNPFGGGLESVVGIALDNSGAILNAQLLHNLIDIGTTAGDGIQLSLSSSHASNVLIEGNDFHNTAVGVRILGSNPASGSLVQVGGISLFGSPVVPGANDFRGLPSFGAAIVQNGPTLVVPAEGNIWPANVDFTKVIADGTRNKGTGAVVTGNQPDLSKRQQFVATLYNDFLGRTAAAVSDLEFWAHQLDTGQATRGQVATAILRSAEGSKRLVDSLYLELLARPADAAGEKAFVTLLQNGGTEEQVIADLAGSDEFVNRAGTIEGSASGTPNTNFIYALYALLLGRSGDGPGVDFWLNVLPSAGRAGVVAAILNSNEFRTDFVKSLYSDLSGLPGSSFFALAPDLLHRTTAPSAAEIAAQVGTGRDLLRLETLLASSTEFFSNG